MLLQVKLQEDFDTVQIMLEEKEKEIEVLTKELTEKSPVDPSTQDSVVSDAVQTLVQTNLSRIYKNEGKFTS